MLLRRGMKDLMSPAVLWNNKSGRQAADLIWRLLHHRNEVEDLLHRLTHSAAAKEYLNFTILKQAWQTVQRQQTPQTAHTIAGVFMRGLAAGIFLEKL